MKFPSLPLLLSLAVLTLPACSTLANRRELYRPKEGSGYWTDRRAQYERNEEGILGVSRYNINRPLNHQPGVPDR